MKCRQRIARWILKLAKWILKVAKKVAIALFWHLLPIEILTIGLLFAFFAWALEHPDQNPWMVTLVGVRIEQVIATYEVLLDGDGEITPANVGFNEICSVLLEKMQIKTPNRLLPGEMISQSAGKFSEEGRLVVYALKAETGPSFVQASTSGYTGRAIKDLQLTGTLDGNDVEELFPTVYDVGAEVKKRFGEHPLYRYSTFFFAIGLGLSLTSAILGGIRKRP